MKKINIKTLTPITLKKEFKDKYQIKNFKETIFIITLDDNYYYYLTSTNEITKKINDMQIVVSKEQAIDSEGNIKNFDYDYTLDFSKIFRIKKEELIKFIFFESPLRINWDKQLDIVINVDKYIGNSKKIKIVLINENVNSLLVLS
ncbi:hypothetical protein [Mycoplasma phocimorsus]|uniref:Uncharacterized protein n=1 Tax=Mycoplasma phocimorsus TaxID=3045839 RepID=A0AAJ1PRH4_9MOLU|nr:hypothetical protein [Mycoplasma phocimorsus]MDJ1645994.1 hypothetical protein [Mycoplasma phocimorsus]MDJ1646274.1 hypothetical protein [Mycoplasma phocimorsus]MDJ1646878.1 hypothetical protein [Mycoplasma phocimorsus]MDJ1647845.1 hypothetical protein [Mycoplasma phocimorsus]MDJ1648454.1 hypothetical protein [Mycoplasma phocimorsus]